MEIMVAGYITVSPPDAEVGISAATGWKPYPLPPAGSRAEGPLIFCVGTYRAGWKLDEAQPAFP